jgi:hypothetical protein
MPPVKAELSEIGSPRACLTVILSAGNLNAAAR